MNYLNKPKLDIIADTIILFCLLLLAYLGKESPYMVSTLIFGVVAIIWVYVCINDV